MSPSGTRATINYNAEEMRLKRQQIEGARLRREARKPTCRAIRTSLKEMMFELVADLYAEVELSLTGEQIYDLREVAHAHRSSRPLLEEIERLNLEGMIEIYDILGGRPLTEDELQQLPPLEDDDVGQ